MIREKWDSIKEHESPQLRIMKQQELIKSVYDDEKEWDEPDDSE